MFGTEQCRSADGRNPVGVVIFSRRWSQGSSFLATLGWRTQSLWDWPMTRVAARASGLFAHGRDYHFVTPSSQGRIGRISDVRFWLWRCMMYKWQTTPIRFSFAHTSATVANPRLASWCIAMLTSSTLRPYESSGTRTWPRM